MTTKQLDFLKPEDYVAQKQFDEYQEFLNDPDNYTGPYDFANGNDDTSAEDELEAEELERHYEHMIAIWAEER